MSLGPCHDQHYLIADEGIPKGSIGVVTVEKAGVADRKPYVMVRFWLDASTNHAVYEENLTVVNPVNEGVAPCE